MATKKPTAGSRARRASQRVVIAIDLAESTLRNIMTEQCRSEGRYLTVYRGSRPELTAAGVPVEAFPNGEQPSEFQLQTLNVCCTGNREMLRGSIRGDVDGLTYELEVDWGFVRPYVQGSHPAVCELARMLLKDIMAWTTTTPWSDTPDLAQPLDMLAADPRATGYKPTPGAPRMQVTPEFHKELASYASRIYQMVHSNCEVLPCANPAPSATVRPSMRVVGGTAIH